MNVQDIMNQLCIFDGHLQVFARVDENEHDMGMTVDFIRNHISQSTNDQNIPIGTPDGYYDVDWIESVTDVMTSREIIVIVCKPQKSPVDRLIEDRRQQHNRSQRSPY